MTAAKNQELCIISYPKEGAAPQIYALCTEKNALETAVKAYNYYNDSAERCTDNSFKFSADDTENISYFLKQAETYKHQRDTIQVIPFDDFLQLERAALLAGTPEETTEEQFQEMLDVLPPRAWCTIDDIEMFCMSEMYTGSYTTQYAHDRETNKYYCKLVDLLDRTTWINTFLRA